MGLSEISVYISNPFIPTIFCLYARCHAELPVGTARVFKTEKRKWTKATFMSRKSTVSPARVFLLQSWIWLSVRIFGCLLYVRTTYLLLVFARRFTPLIAIFYAHHATFLCAAFAIKMCENNKSDS